jgi:D-alanine-D-alanine ligase
MRVAVLYNSPEPGAPDSEDVLAEAAFVREGLAALGHEEVEIPCTGGALGLSLFAGALAREKPDVVFNLIESLDGDARLHPAAAAALRIIGMPHTGAPYEALMTTTDKALTKTLLRAHGIPTPPWAIYTGVEGEARLPLLPCIAKPVWEDASIGIHDSSVFPPGADLAAGLEALCRRYGPLLVEGFVEGREFNVSVLERTEGGAEVLPPAEMLFRDWPEGKPRIVNYSAKWDATAFEFHNTVRRFPTGEDGLMREIAETAHLCWNAFGLRGYARVDMRIDAGGRPQVIEINANPCISPDSGFVAAAAEAGLGAREIVGRILHAALRGHRREAAV